MAKITGQQNRDNRSVANLSCGESSVTNLPCGESSGNKDETNKKQQTPEAVL